jgi:hypothetical protein
VENHVGDGLFASHLDGVVKCRNQRLTGDLRNEVANRRDAARERGA